MTPTAAQITLLIYSALLAIGGAIGYAKAKSRPSLIAGIGSAILALISAGLIQIRAEIGLGLGAILAAALALFFGIRYASSRKVMPAGLMAITSLVVVILLVIALVMAPEPATS